MCLKGMSMCMCLNGMSVSMSVCMFVEGMRE